MGANTFLAQNISTILDRRESSQCVGACGREVCVQEATSVFSRYNISVVPILISIRVLIDNTLIYTTDFKYRCN